MQDELDQLDTLTADDERDLQIANLRYALRCHIPAMKRHVHIHTGYGTVDFRGPQARKVTALCEELLQKQLQRLERKHGWRRPGFIRIRAESRHMNTIKELDWQWCLLRALLEWTKEKLQPS